MTNFKIEGLDELTETLNTIEKLPQKHVNKAVRKGAVFLRKEIRNNAPELTNHLKLGIDNKPEKNSKKGMKFYDIIFDPAMTRIFRKSIKNKGKYGGKNDTGYYPASMEYGFKTGNGEGKAGGYVVGHRFMKNTSDANDKAVKEMMVKVLADEIDKIPAEGRTRLR